MTMNDHWGYNKHDNNWKSSADLIHKLVDIASKGGNFLLNIGPTPSGEFPPEAIERLRAIGAWMKVNSESIYGTQASPFAQLDWGRCTMKRDSGGTTLYLHVFTWPKNGLLVVPGVGNDKCSARLLNDASKPLNVSRSGSDVVIALPAAAPDAICSVIALSVDGEAIVYQPPVINAVADILVDSMPVTIAVPGAAKGPLEVRYSVDGSEPGMQSPLAEDGKPVMVSDSCTLKARTFHAGKPASAVVERQFTRVNPQPAQPKGGNKPGLFCSVYEGDWSALPDFDTMNPTRSEDVPEVVLPPGRAEERVARLYSGWIDIPADGLYEFSLTSDDGSRLMIGGRVVIENNGLHPSLERRGVVALGRGLHTFIVMHFNKTGAAELSVRMALAGQPLKPIDPAWFTCAR
jgi:alpha-L-fucosidase